ncbi:N-acetylneuraminate synthase family protein [Clostridium tyrobutyricum]|uniref:N-acetylneuraminate synthase family protein n=1 Tax=Clostridium tyrobutyricum TaxID=1519 RepID=UPI00073D7656|nr:N-acetylneuraminate synthase family protein [Clostridium tyrobutyricum]
MQKVEIANSVIDDNSKTFIIAEIGTNHNQCIEKAKKLIDVSAEAEVDAVKFQIYHPLDIVNKNILTSEYGLEKVYEEKYWYKVLENHLKTPTEWFPELSDYARKKGLKVIATVHCKECAEKMKDYIDAYKVASMDLNHIPLIEVLSEYNLPIIISTGMAYLSEIDEAIRCIEKKKNNICILHCVSSYPAKYSELNLNNIPKLQQLYKYPVGFSDHTMDVLSSVIAVSLGAKIIEKHITLNKFDIGPDHIFALEPQQLKELVNSVRKTEKAIKNQRFEIGNIQYAKRSLYRRSIVSCKKISKGTIITEDMLTFSRPGNGIEPKFINSLINKKAKIDIEEGHIITWDCI